MRLFVCVIAVAFLGGCGALSQHNTVAIRDSALPPNLSVSPPAMTINAGEEVTWVNQTNTVLALRVWEENADQPGFLSRIGSKIGFPDGQRQKPDPDQIQALETALKEQQTQLAEIKSQLAETPERAESLNEKLDILAGKLAEQQAQLSALQAQPVSPDSENPHQFSAFIPSYSRAKSKFLQPGHYQFSLFQTSSNRRAGRVQGTLTVLP